MIRILVPDDHAGVRRGLKQILAEHPSTVEVGEARDASDMLRLVRQGRWDIVLLDITTHGRSASTSSRN